MKKYESTITKHILENPILLPNNFLKILDDFKIYQEKNISNSNNQNNKQNNINFIQNNNNNQNNEIFISFGKNPINNGELSPIPSSDSQKNKFSSNTTDKYQDNLSSPIPICNTIIPIIKDININDSEKNDIPPLFPTNNFKDIKIKTPNEGIKYINQDKNKNSQNTWKKFKEFLIFQKLIENKFNDTNGKSNFFNFIPKNAIVKLLIFSKKNDIFNENNQNINNININNDISTDLKISNEPTSKVEATTRIILTNNSIDDIADNSNIYYRDKDNYEEQHKQYEPTNIKKILNTKIDIILDENKFNTLIQDLLSGKFYTNEKVIQERENEEYNNNIIIKNNNINNTDMFKIIEVDEDNYDQNSRKPSLKKISFGKFLNLNGSNESEENSIQFNQNKEIKDEKQISNPFLTGGDINLDNNINKKENDSDKIKKIEIKDFSEFFKPQPNNLNNIELKLNNIENNNNNSNNNNNENKNELLFGHIINKQNLKNTDDNNNDNKNNKESIDILFKEPYQPFSFGKNDFNDISIKKNESQNEKNDSKPTNKEIENNFIITFDKNKNEAENKKNVEITEFDNNKNNEKNDIDNEKINIDNNKNKIENLEAGQLIENKDSNINNNEKDDNEINMQYFSFKPKEENNDQNKESQKDNSIKKEKEIINKFSPEKKIENEVNDLNNTNELKNNDTENLILISNNKNEESIKFENNEDNNMKEPEKKEELEIKIVKDDIIDLEKNNLNPDENKVNNSLKITNNEDNTNTNSYKEKENNQKIIEEKILLNISDCKDGNPSKKIDFNKFINSPEVFPSIKSKSITLNNNISIRSNLFNIKPKIITNLQIKNIQKLYPNFNIVISDKNINKEFLKYFLNDYNRIVFTNNFNDMNMNKYKIKLKSYFNILKKLNRKIFYFHEPLIEDMINKTLKQVDVIKQKNNIKNISLVENSKDKNIKVEKDDEAMNFVFFELNSKLKDIQKYYQNIINKKKVKNNIDQLRENLNIAFSDVIRYINRYIDKKYNNSPIYKIKYYQKVVNDLNLYYSKDNNVIKKNTKNIQKEKNSNAKKENSFRLKNPLFIVGIIFLIICFLVKFFY